MISLPASSALPIDSSLHFEDWFNIANCAAQRFSNAMFDDDDYDRALGEAETMSFATCRAFDEAYGELAIIAVLKLLSKEHRG